MIKRWICWAFGHDWAVLGGFDYIRLVECRRCGKRAVQYYSHTHRVWDLL